MSQDQTAPLTAFGWFRRICEARDAIVARNHCARALGSMCSDPECPCMATAETEVTADVGPMPMKVHP